MNFYPMPSLLLFSPQRSPGSAPQSHPGLPQSPEYSSLWQGSSAPACATLTPPFLDPGLALLLHVPLLIILKYTHRSRLRFMFHQEVSQYVFLNTLIDRAVHSLLLKMWCKETALTVFSNKTASANLSAVNRELKALRFS